MQKGSLFSFTFFLPFRASWFDLSIAPTKKAPQGGFTLEKENKIDAEYFGDILALAREIYLLRKFDITAFHSVAI